MEIFVAVVEAGSLTATAERFDLSSAMVGEPIRSLEAQLAARLLERMRALSQVANSSRCSKRICQRARLCI